MPLPLHAGARKESKVSSIAIWTRHDYAIAKLLFLPGSQGRLRTEHIGTDMGVWFWFCYIRVDLPQRYGVLRLTITAANPALRQQNPAQSEAAKFDHDSIKKVHLRCGKVAFLHAAF